MFHEKDCRFEGVRPGGILRAIHLPTGIKMEFENGVSRVYALNAMALAVALTTVQQEK